jgi:hypothetical protein
MFKKLTLLITIITLFSGLLSACSSATTTLPASGIVSIKEEQVATVPPPEKEETSAPKAMSVSDFIKSVKDQDDIKDYIGEVIVISGEIKAACLLPNEDPIVGRSLANAIFLGENIDEFCLRFRLKDETKVKVGDKVTVEGKVYQGNLSEIRIGDAVIK